MTALASLRQILAAARSRAALVPGLGELITGIETHLVTEAHRLTGAAGVAADAMRELEELRSRVRTLESIASTVPRDVPAALADLRARIDAIDRKPATLYTSSQDLSRQGGF